MKNYVFTESYLNLLYEVYDKDSEYFKKLLKFLNDGIMALTNTFWKIEDKKKLSN